MTALAFPNTPTTADEGWLARRLLDARAAPLTVQRTLGCQKANACLRSTTPLLANSRRAYWQFTDSWLAAHPQDGGPGVDGGDADAQARPTTRQEARNQSQASAPLPEAGKANGGPSDAPVDAPEALHVEFTIIKALQPKRISKGYELKDGQLIKVQGGQLTAGMSHRCKGNLHALARLVRDNRPDAALVLGVAKAGGDKHRVIPQVELTPELRQEGYIARTQTDFGWPEGAGFLLIDSDTEMARDEIMGRLLTLCPQIAQAPILQYDSSSGWLFDAATGRELRGQGGLHNLIVIKDAAHAPEAAEVLQKLAFARDDGSAWLEVGNAGQTLRRSIIDTAAASGPERLVFSFGADCGPGLEQRRPASEVFNNDAEPLDTRKHLKLIPELEEAARQVIDGLAADPAFVTEKKLKRDAWMAKRLPEMLAHGQQRRKAAGLPAMTAGETKQAKKKLTEQLERMSASHSNTGAASVVTLEADFVVPFNDGTHASVAELFADPERFDGKRGPDPFEPDYGDDDRIAQVHLTNTKGGPIIHSHAHGGIVYRLLPSAASVFDVVPQDDAAEREDAGGKSIARSERNDHYSHALRMVDLLTQQTGQRPVFWGGQFWTLNEAAIWRPLTIDHASTLVGRHFGGQVNAKRANDFKAIATMAANIVEDPHFFDDAPAGVASPGKFWRIEDGKVLSGPLNAGHRQRVCMPADPIMGQPPTMVLKVLTDAMGTGARGQEQIAMLRQCLAAVLVGRLHRYRIALCLKGETGSGKSLVLNVISALFPPDMVGATPPSHWDKDYFIAAMAGKRLNLVGELDPNKPIPGGAFKAVLGGDELQGRHPNHRPFEFRNTAAHIFNGNRLPPTSDRSDAFFARWRIAVFENAYPPENAVIDLAERIIANELPQVAGWLLEEAARLPDSTLMVSTAHTEELAHWRYANNSAAAFVLDPQWCIRDPGARVSGAELFNSYDLYASDVGLRGARAPQRNTFYENLAEAGQGLGVSRFTKDHTVWFRGVALAPRHAHKMRVPFDPVGR